MSRTEPDRPAPETFLRAAAREGRGRLKIFLGAAPGVGKTYEMLSDARALQGGGTDLVVGVVETHGRKETQALVDGLEIIPRREADHQGHRLAEMDIDALLARAPQLALVDELAHTNAPGSRHPKRWQDVAELLDAGINVYSTLNIQHVESLNDVVASFTRVRVRETVPDSILDDADIEVVDIPPDELIARLEQGKVYLPEEASRALSHFFSKSNLSALRELALRRAAQTVDAQMLEHVRAHALGGTWAGTERVLVAVSEQPGAENLVRAAKRIADAQHAPWTAVHIETKRTQRFTPADHARVAAAIDLAAQLGAQVASVPAAHIVDGLKAYAADARATQLVVGKSARSRWFELLHGSVVDRLVRETPDVAVHVLPVETAPAGQRGSAPKPAGAWGKPSGYAWTLLLVAAITAVGVALSRVLDIGNVGLLYLLPVMAAAILFGLRAGLLAGVASSLAYNFFFLPPLYTLTIANPANVVSIFVLLGIAVATSQLAARVRAQAEIAAGSARTNAELAGFLRLLTAENDRAAVTRLICAELSRMFAVQAVLLEAGPTGLAVQSTSAPDVQLGPMEMAAAQWTADRGQPAGQGSGTLAGSEWLFQPLRAGGQVLAVIGFAREDSGAAIRPDQLPMLSAQLDQAALALERLRLEGEMRDVEGVRQRDRLRAALLSSVSHDLRTPLTAILAAAAELRRAPRGDLIDTVEAEARRLNRFVANLLDMTRLEAGALPLHAEPTDLTDAVAQAVHDARAALEGHEVRLEVPPDLPLVRLDPQLFHHCLLNLLDNAGRYSPPSAAVAIVARRFSDGIRLTILDQGPGLPPGREGEVFETFHRLEGSDRLAAGTGLGLAIVKGFAEAMGLRAEAANRTDGPGAAFTIEMPERLIVRSRTQEDQI